MLSCSWALIRRIKIIWFADQQPFVYISTILILLVSLLRIVISCNCILVKLILSFDPTFLLNAVAKSNFSKYNLLES